jgi:acetyl esterase/lipase
MLQYRFGVVGFVVLAFAVDVFAQNQPQQLPAGVKALRDVAYVKDGHERQKLDLYLPEKADGALPVIVWIHGGGWQAGSKDRCPAVRYVPRGYAVASVNYRLSSHATFPAQIEDCKAAIRWLRANAKEHKLDADNIGVWGASAGGHLVALLGTACDCKELEGKLGNNDQSSKVKCVCNWFGPADFRPLIEMSTGAEGPVTKLLGGPVKDHKEKATLASPVTHVTKDDAPFLIMHGDQDKLVPISQSQSLADALRKAGVEVTFQTLPGAAHGGPAFNSDESMKLIGDFFDKHLKTKK